MHTCTQLTSSLMMSLSSRADPISCPVAQLSSKQSKARRLLVLIQPIVLFILDKACQLILHSVELLLRIQSVVKSMKVSMERPTGSLRPITLQECNTVPLVEARPSLSLSNSSVSSFCRIVLPVRTNTYT